MVDHLHGVSCIITEAIVTMATVYYGCVCTVCSVHVDVCMLVRLYDFTMYVQPGVDLICHFEIGRFPLSELNILAACVVSHMRVLLSLCTQV